jgi:hypothetical protein
MDHERPPFERVLDLALYAPVGAAMVVRERLPAHIRQGRQAMENRVQLARFIGQMAVQVGQREIAKRLEEQRVARHDRPGVDAADAAAMPHTIELDENHDDLAAIDGDPRQGVVADSVGGSAIETGMAPLPADELPISGYESLAAIHVVERLRSMRPDEIEQIRRFEAAHRSRRTILAKIDQLQGR